MTIVNMAMLIFALFRMFIHYFWYVFSKTLYNPWTECYEDILNDEASKNPDFLYAGMTKQNINTV